MITLSGEIVYWECDNIHYPISDYKDWPNGVQQNFKNGMKYDLKNGIYREI